MVDLAHAPPCGLYCGDCEFLGKNCEGCGHVAGKPFWSCQVPGGICPIYDCCMNKKGLSHCGECEDLPCEVFLQLKDPNLSDEAFAASLKDRQTQLLRRKEVGTERWLAEKCNPDE